MTCNICGGSLKVIDTVNTPRNEIYRKKRCDNCGELIFTVEEEIEYDYLRDEWNKYHRKWKGVKE